MLAGTAEVVCSFALLPPRLEQGCGGGSAQGAFWGKHAHPMPAVLLSGKRAWTCADRVSVIPFVEL